jgi:hypothetical protein
MGPWPVRRMNMAQEEVGDMAVLPLDDDVLDLLLERNPTFIEECPQIRERMRQGHFVTFEEALQRFKEDL